MINLYIQDEILPAEYIVFDDKITKEKNEAISSLLKDDHTNKEFFDIIITSVDSLEDEATFEFISYFQLFTIH